MNVQNYIDDYAAWLKSKITFEEIGEYYEITTPFLDNANDSLQIYVKKDGDTILFTDDGATMNGLAMTGFSLTPAREDHLKRILMQCGVTLDGDALTAKAPATRFAPTKHALLQAMMRVDDMFALSSPRATSYFLDDIQDFLDGNDIFYTDAIQVSGKSGLSHSYDFVFQRTPNKPERLCRAVNRPDKSNTANLLFSWSDTQSSRRKESQLIAILNDRKGVPRGVVDAFHNYDAEVILWSQINQRDSIELLSA